MQPIETWQFALSDEPEANGLEEVLQTVDVTADAPKQEQPEAGELELELQAELARLEAETSLSQVAQVEVEKSIDPAGAEKGIEADSPSSALVENLKSGDRAKRAAALRELAEQDEDEAFQMITELFDNGAAEVRNAAALALYEFKSDRAASFTRALREGSLSRRHNIAVAISGSGLAAEAIDNLGGASREKTYDAFSILFLMARAGEVHMLLQAIERHEDVGVRLSVIKLLTFCNQPDVIPAFRSLAVRAALPTEVRSAVMEAIYQISSNARQNSLSVA